MAKNARRRHESSDRRGKRYAKIGRQFESEVADHLRRMQEEKLIAGFVHHAPKSKADHEGCDFTVTVLKEGKEVERSFGVTISLQSWNRSKVLHPDVRQYCFPIGTKPETIRARILELFGT